LNAILSGIDALRDQFEPKRFGIGEGASCVILTPRFRTSRHIVGLLIPSGKVEPALVVKMPRLHGDAEGIEREAAVLNALRAACPEAREAVPCVVALATGDHPLLVETALAGPLVTRAMLRANPSRWVDAVVSWLITLSPTRENADEAAYERLLEEPLALLAASFPPGTPEEELVARTLELVEPLRGAHVPHVFEHGDFSHPNLIRLGSDRVGVVDWELAEEQGLPLHDLAFFLTYATFALRRPRTADEHVAAFHDSFFSAAGWAMARMTAYARKLELDPHALTPLFAACWARYTARLVVRIAGARPGQLSEEGAAWVRQNRYYALWRHTIAHVDDLAWR